MKHINGHSHAAVMTCNFCGREGHEVFMLVKGPEAIICDGCIDHANDIVKKGRLTKALDTISH